MSDLTRGLREAPCRFAATEQSAQVEYYAREFTDLRKRPKHAFILAGDDRYHGLQQPIREVTKNLFQELCIQFHTFVGHGRSSQACCLNFLMPFADKPEALSKWVGHVLEITPPTMLEIEGPAAGAHRFVAFEYTGPDKKDFLDECNGRTPGRGANATAADAAVAFVDASGRRTLLLIEWKYTEEYRKHQLSKDKKGKRNERYADKLFDPQGPMRADAGLTFEDILHEPFYQLARQQMLAWQIERRSDRFDAVRNLHLSPSGNRALHLVTSPGFARLADDAFAAFRASLVHPDHFIEKSIEHAFAPLADWPEMAESWTYLRNRYPSLCPDKDPA